LQQVQVEAAVVVEVEERRPGAHDLRHEELAGGPGLVDEVQAPFLGHVMEPRGVGGRLGGRTGRRARAAGRASAGQEQRQSGAVGGHEPSSFSRRGARKKATRAGGLPEQLSWRSRKDSKSVVNLVQEKELSSRPPSSGLPLPLMASAATSRNNLDP